MDDLAATSSPRSHCSLLRDMATASATAAVCWSRSLPLDSKGTTGGESDCTSGLHDCQEADSSQWVCRPPQTRSGSWSRPKLMAGGAGDLSCEKFEQERVVPLTELQLASMMNHGCDANVSVSFAGRQMIVRAVRDIPAGQEIGETKSMWLLLTPLRAFLWATARREELDGEARAAHVAVSLSLRMSNVRPRCYSLPRCCFLPSSLAAWRLRRVLPKKSTCTMRFAAAAVLARE
eukprot:768706-Hanusia_phi.AAC.3